MCRLRKVAVGSLGHRQKACLGGAGSEEFHLLSPMCSLRVFTCVPLGEY